MDVRRILSEIDAEIAKLQSVRSTLTGLSGSIPGVSATGTAGRRGRPKGSRNTPKPATATRAKRVLSPEARKRIADAQKRRWAERKNTKEKAK